MRYLIDTDYLIDATADIPAAIATLATLSDQVLAVSIVSYGEIFEGAFGNPAPFATLAGYREFLSDYPTLPLTDPIMERFASLRSILRRRGLLIPDLDLLIAATALEHDLQLLTRNRRHFDRIPDLSIYQPG